MNTPRKYKKQINKNSWMVKIQRWTFGEAYTFTGFCPFFWVTFLCLLLSPLTLIGKILEFSWNFLINSIDFDSWDKYKKVRREEKYKFRPEKYANSILTVNEICEKLNCEPWEIQDKIYNTENPVDQEIKHLYFECWDFNEVVEWAQENKNWRHFLRRALQIVENQKAEAEKREKIAARNKKNMKKLAYYAPFIVKPAIILSAIIVAYLVYKFLFSIILSIFTLSNLFYIGTCLGIVAVLGGAVFLAWTAGQKVVELGGEVIKNIPVSAKKEKRVFLFDIAISFIVNTFVFIKDAISMVYTKECPLIEWVDGETQPIEKNK